MREFKMNAGTRRDMLRTGLAVVAGTVGAVATARAQDQKIAQELVQYQNQPKEGAKCAGCAQFQAPNACAIVAGNISPNGWCVAYAPKEG